MAFSYTEMVNDIDTLVEDLGKAVTLFVSSETPASSSQPWRGNGSPATEAATAVEYGFDFADVDGTLVRRGDVKFAIAAKDHAAFNMASVDKITVGTTVYGVVSVNIINPGGTAIAYVYHARK